MFVVKNTNPNTIRVRDLNIIVSNNYNPLEDQNQYMNDVQLAYFKKKLMTWKADLHRQTLGTIASMSEIALDKRSVEDGDRTDDEVETITILRKRDRHRKLVHKIDEAVRRIEIGTYGYCEKTGEEIGISRLIARPIAIMSIEAQKKHEEMENSQEKAEYTRKIIMIEEEI
ncbi:TraR/DksA C4-type zinc finger protein [Rickettsiales bacterium]|nr:TraR/DksA C4-type zinc finger protein [Rickettsiales bacterium]